MESGRMLTHYRVEERIGRGGMGEVWRAHDTVLGRDVALKLLPAEFAADPDRLARFQREAKLLAALHHPNIASIFGFETDGDVTFLVMELVEGEDLAQVLRRGALPVDEAVDIARQVAEGLEEAHEKGIVHRDLKPANVKRTAEGKVKVLDFGLARAFAGQSAGEEALGSAPTLTAAVTQAGTVIGTAAYMSPEQARGKEVDRRTDIWAFGVMLFEMLTGRQLFAGETASDTLAGILKSEPDWSALPAGLPLQVERVVRRCLAKDPRQRLRDIGEARVRLEDPAAESGVFTGPMEAARNPRPGWRAWLPWAIATVAALAAVWFALDRGGNPPTPYRHLAVPAPEGVDFAIDGTYPGLPAVSPDGRFVAFAGYEAAGNGVQLYVRPLDADDAVALAGTENAQYPFWSPDSRWIAFYDRNRGLLKVPATGGPVQTICKAGNGKGGSWNAAGQIILTPDYNKPLELVPAVGGEPQPLTDLKADTGYDSHRHPQFLPDGKHYLYFARAAGGKTSQMRLASLDGGPAKAILTTSIAARYAEGRLLFMNESTLMAQPFDPAAGTLSGVAVPVASDVLVLPGASVSSFSTSDEGTLTYLRGKVQARASLVWLDRAGAVQDTVSDRAVYDTAVLSPDGKLAAVTVLQEGSGTGDVWIIDLARNFRTRLTTAPADDFYPVWSPDSRVVYFASDRTGHYAVFRKEVGGTAPPDSILQLDDPVIPWEVTADGKTLIYSLKTGKTDDDLWAADLDGGAPPRLLVGSPRTDGAARLSPDNRWITYYSTESGEGQVYVAPWPAMSPVTQVSTTTGTWSFWTRDGREIIYQDGSGKVYAVPVAPGPRGLEIGAPTALFDHTGPKYEGPWLWPAADGQRFLAVDLGVSDVPAYCEVVQGWTRKLQVR